MNAWLRQHRYALMVTVRRLIKQPFSSWPTCWSWPWPWRCRC